MGTGLDGQVAFITGVARGQGRAHAVRLARDGADIIGVDICADIPSMNYPNATEDDLAETVRLVEKEGRRMLGRKADVRDFSALQAAFQAGLDLFGRVDIIVANAGITRIGKESDEFLADWEAIVGTNLTGVFHTVRVALPAMRSAGRGGSIVIVSSTVGIKGSKWLEAGLFAYSASKHGMVGLMQNLANVLAPEWIRVNTVHPTAVRSGMTQNAVVDQLMADAAAGRANAISAMQNALPVGMLEPEDVANAVAFLVSERGRYVTGIQFPVDAGYCVK